MRKSIFPAHAPMQRDQVAALTQQLETESRRAGELEQRAQASQEQVAKLEGNVRTQAGDLVGGMGLWVCLGGLGWPNKLFFLFH